MSARDVIEIMKSLPEAERKMVIQYFDTAPPLQQTGSPGQKLGVDEAIEHVFKNYDGLLAKLAQ